MTVEGLARGRSAAKESPPRLPVPLWEIIPVLAEVPITIRDMLLMQWYTGARPGEIRLARPDQFQHARDGSLLWTLDRHKNAHRGHVRVIPIGPRGETILKPYFTLAESQGQEYLFDPRNAPRSRGRKNPYYTKDSCNQAIERGQEKVNKRRAEEERPPLKWTPHQIRHAMGQRLEAEEGIEAVNAMLGHSTYSASSIYAHGKLKIAKDIARRYG